MKKYSVVWTEVATRQLDCIYEYYSETSEKPAMKIVKDILSETNYLKGFPLSGRRFLIGNNDTGFRQIFSGHFTVIYKISKKNHQIIVASVFDTRQNPEVLANNLLS